MFVGELISVGVAISWTISALVTEYASRRMGSPSLNVWRLSAAFIMTGLVVLIGTDSFVAPAADAKAWGWMSVSGLTGYLFGDFCLFYSYIVIGSRFGQLFMTLAPPVAAVTGFFVLDEKMSWLSLVGMIVTLGGISLSIFGKDGTHLSIKLPTKGVLLGIGAGIGQGLGLVFSKLGMRYYEEAAAGEVSSTMIPIAASQMRMVVAIIGFLLVVCFVKGQNHLSVAIHERKVAWSIFFGAIFGPLVGVSMSMMALQYTARAA